MSGVIIAIIVIGLVPTLLIGGWVVLMCARLAIDDARGRYRHKRYARYVAWYELDQARAGVEEKELAEAR